MLLRDRDALTWRLKFTFQFLSELWIYGCVGFEYISIVCFQAKITELQKLLESMQSVEDQVNALREKKSALDQEMEHAATAQRQSSGGVWRLFGGSEK